MLFFLFYPLKSGYRSRTFEVRYDSDTRVRFIRTSSTTSAQKKNSTGKNDPG